VFGSQRESIPKPCRKLGLTRSKRSKTISLVSLFATERNVTNATDINKTEIVHDELFALSFNHCGV